MAKKLVSFDESTGELPPAVLTELDARFYNEPVAGIPKADLASAVQTSLGKADTASQPGHTHVPADVVGLTPLFAAKADLVGGLVPQSQIPAIALTEFLGAVASQAAMLALTGQRGDWCTRTDRGTDFQLIAEPATILANWRERTYPASPVSSVNGRTGAVTTDAADITDATVVGRALMRAVDASAARAALSVQPTASPTFTGTTTVPTLVIPTGAGAGKVLTSDGTGQATWQTPAAGLGDATTGVKGVVKLAGDLGGTADLPTVPNKADKDNPTFTTRITTPALRVTTGAAAGLQLYSDASGNATWREAPMSTVYVPGGTQLIATSGTPAVQTGLTALTVDPLHTLDTDGLNIPTGRYLIAVDVVWGSAQSSTTRSAGIYDGTRHRLLDGIIAYQSLAMTQTFLVDVTAASQKIGMSFLVDSSSTAPRTIAAGNVTRMTVTRL
jgi:hypothetical protein